MKKLILLFAISLFSMWLISGFFLLGLLPIPFANLTLPNSTSDFGNSMGIINGLLSAITITIALAAVCYQSKELRESTKVLNDQTESLVDYLKQKQISNKIIAISTRQSFLSNEIHRMDTTMSDIKGQTEKMNVFCRCKDKKNNYIIENDKLNAQIVELMRWTDQEQ